VRDMSDHTDAPDATVAAVHGQRFCPDTEEVTGSNPVSPTSIIPGQLDCVQFRFMLDHRVLVAV
jgi:hypothetical protein